MTVPNALLYVCLAITLLAAIYDARTGHIPNWLTLPPLLAGPIVWGVWGGLLRAHQGPPMGTAVGCLVSIALCAMVPFLLRRIRIGEGGSAMGGGDVKLFGAIGALTLANVGLETLFYASCALSLFALARLAWEGVLLRTLGNVLFLMFNPVLPKKYRRKVQPQLMTKMRFGPAIFVGMLCAALANNQVYGLL